MSDATESSGKIHDVEQGECLNSIAKAHGFFWNTLWDLPENADLKSKRKDPNVLLPGDQVVIPEKRLKQESGATERRHRFKRKGVPAGLRIRVLKDGQPRADTPYELTIDGARTMGNTDDDGVVEIIIPPGAVEGTLVVGTDDDVTVYELSLAHLDPVDTVTGVQARLANLGFDPGEIDGIMGPNTRDALRGFQLAWGLKETGEPDADTKDKLLEVHGS